MTNNLAKYDFIDIHYHASPDLYQRRLNALTAGLQYQEEKGIVVLRSHIGSTSIQATLAQREGFPVLPSLSLNAIAGGIHYRLIMQALLEFEPSFLEGHMIVDFPTLTGRPYQSKLKRQTVHSCLEKYSLRPETMFNEENQLRQEVVDIVKMANDYPIVLSTGHASKEEIFSLIELADKYKLKALLINQPANPLTNLTACELKEIANHYPFVYTEQTALTYLLGHQTKDDLASCMQSIPKLIYSSDLGQPNQMDIKTWLNFSNELAIELQLLKERQKELFLKNALKLLSLAPV